MDNPIGKPSPSAPSSETDTSEILSRCHVAVLEASQHPILDISEIGTLLAPSQIYDLPHPTCMVVSGYIILDLSALSLGIAPSHFLRSIGDRSYHLQIQVVLSSSLFHMMLKTWTHCASAFVLQVILAFLYTHTHTEAVLLCTKLLQAAIQA